MKKYSNQFERDWKLYSSEVIQQEFSFSGKSDSEFIGKISSSCEDKSAKQCFHVLDSTGKVIGCSEPLVLLNVLKTKAAINFQIKQWAESMKEGTLLPQELHEIEKQYEFPAWVADAVRRQSGTNGELVAWHKEYILKLIREKKNG